MSQRNMVAIIGQKSNTDIYSRLFAQVSNVILLFIILIFVAPFLSLLSSLFYDSGTTLSHLFDTVLGGYLLNSISLLIGVSLLVLLMGVSTAWLLSNYKFTGSSIFSWALYLPIAIPAYISAFSYAGLLEYAGPIQSFIRDFWDLGKGEYFFPDVRSIGGAIFILSITFYPYVYILTRVAFESAGGVVNVGKSMGFCNNEVFCKIAVNYAKPSIIMGLTLVCLEVLGDFGAVQFLAVDTFTTAIYRTWFSSNNYIAASNLSLMLLAIVIFLIVIEKKNRSKAKYYNNTSFTSKIVKTRLSGWKNMLAFNICFLPVLLGFIIPVSILLYNYIKNFDDMKTLEISEVISNSILVSSLAAILAVIISCFVSYKIFSIVGNKKAIKFISYVKIINVGYAIPGTIVAVCVLMFYGWVDRGINEFIDVGLIFSGTLFALVIAYVFRFLALSSGALESGMHGITREIDWSARIFGMKGFMIFRKIHYPIIKKYVLVAAMLVFVECMKELPITYIIRPFNFNTLSIKTYELASDEQLIESSFPALIIILISLFPVYFTCKKIFSDKE